MSLASSLSAGTINNRSASPPTAPASCCRRSTIRFWTHSCGAPHAYRDVAAPGGTALLVEVSGDCGGLWCLRRSNDDWLFASELPPIITAHVTIPQAIAWRIFTKGIDRASARAQLTIQGDVPLAEHILELIAIVG
jgi:hypothetical protein